MNYYEVIGVESKSGVSKKSGKPYDISIIYLKSASKLATGDGYSCCNVIFNNSLRNEYDYYPCVGDCVTVLYNRSGFCIGFAKC